MGRSRPVSTARTPLTASAWLVSTDRMRAWAWVLRSNAPTSIPGMDRSSVNRACPVTLAIASTLGPGRPTTFSAGSTVGGWLSRDIAPPSVLPGPDWRGLAPGPLGGEQDRFDDLLITGAPAQVAGQPRPDVARGRRRVGREHGVRGEQHAWTAVAALGRPELGKRDLERVGTALFGPIRLGPIRLGPIRRGPNLFV